MALFQDNKYTSKNYYNRILNLGFGRDFTMVLDCLNCQIGELLVWICFYDTQMKPLYFRRFITSDK